MTSVLDRIAARSGHEPEATEPAEGSMGLGRTFIRHATALLVIVESRRVAEDRTSASSLPMTASSSLRTGRAPSWQLVQMVRFVHDSSVKKYLGDARTSSGLCRVGECLNRAHVPVVDH